MKQLIEAFKSARKTEILLIIAATCALLLCLMGTNAKDSVSTDEEIRLQHILSQVEGAGKVRVMLAKDEEGVCRGAIVAATGADEIRVQLRLQQAIHTITGLEIEQIEVVKSKR